MNGIYLQDCDAHLMRLIHVKCLEDYMTPGKNLLQMVIAAMKLKDAYSLEGKL